MQLEAINYELSGGSFNRKRRRLATFTLTTVGNKVIVSDDRPSFVAMFYKNTEFDNADAAVSYWGMIDESRMILG